MQPLELHRTGPVVKTSCRIHTEVEVVLAMHHISYAVMHPTHTHFKSPRKQRDAHVHHRTIQYKASRRLNTTRSGLFKGERKKNAPADVSWAPEARPPCPFSPKSETRL